MGSRHWAGRHQLWQVNPHLHYRRDQRDRGPIGSLRWCCWRGRRRGTKHSRGNQAGDKRGLMKGFDRSDWENDVGRHDQRNINKSNKAFEIKLAVSIRSGVLEYTF